MDEALLVELFGEAEGPKNCKTCQKLCYKPYKYSKQQWKDFAYCGMDCLWKAKIKNNKPKKTKMKIAFVWQGISDEKTRDAWQDGLRYAIDKIGEKHKVTFYEPWDDIVGEDIILYWEAPVTAQGANAPHYHKVRQNPTKKALLFAGGLIKKEWVNGFDLLFVESKINEGECDALGIPWHHAFGINHTKFKRTKNAGARLDRKQYKAGLHGTCASWKRQWLIGEAFGKDAWLAGKGQDSDPYPFRRCEELGVEMNGTMFPRFIAEKLEKTWVLVNPADYWGGGQRATLEAMSCGVPVVCCNDSPKNMEFIQESGFGAVCEPTAESIRNAVEGLVNNYPDFNIGVNYILNKWSGDIYAEQLLEGIKKITNDTSI